MARGNAELLELKEPRDFEPWARGYGPDPGAACLCGSGLPARFCHRDDQGQWYASPPPLLTDEPTGYAHPGCYANTSLDCSMKRSNEHWLSKAILEEIADPLVTIQGLAWAGGHTRALPPSSLGSNILCDRHNQALSHLDSTALAFFTTIRQYAITVRQVDGVPVSKVAVLCGEAVELWMLKLVWGALVARALPWRDGEPTLLRPLPDGRAWTDILFRGGRWRAGWGMYGLVFEGTFTPEGHLQMEAKYGTDGALWSMAFELGPVAFHLCLGVPGDQLWRPVRRPSGFVLRSEPAGHQLVLALTWRQGGGTPLFPIYQGEGVGPRTPSGSPRH